jgi:hypothetical protein
MRIKVRIEETLIGAMLGAAAGVAMSSPITCGLTQYFPGGGSFGEIFQLSLLWLSGLVGGFGGSVYASWQQNEQHVRGVRLERDPHQAKKRLSEHERSKMSKRQLGNGRETDLGGRVKGLAIGGVELARSRETEHLIVTGLPGSGKTVVLRSIIDQVLDRRDRLMIHDPKGDLTATYFDPETTVLLGLWDKRAWVWDIGNDVDSPAMAREFAKAVCGATDAKGDNKFFVDQASALLAAILMGFMKDGRSFAWKDLGKVLSATPLSYVTFACNADPRICGDFANLLTNGESPNRTEQGVISELNNATDWIRQVAAVDHQNALRFSMRGWLTKQSHHQVQLVVLNSNSLYKKAGGSIFSAILAVMAETVTSSLMPEVSADDEGLWLVLDEFPQLGAQGIAHIQNIAELGRSRGVREVLALQEESQITALLGRDKAEPVLRVQRARAYLGCEANTADAVVKRIGKREILLIETTAQSGALQGKTMRPDSRDVLSQSDLLGLKVTESGPEMLLHIGDVIGKLVQPFGPKRPGQAEAFVESNEWKFGRMARSEADVAGDQQSEEELDDAQIAHHLTQSSNDFEGL